MLAELDQITSILSNVCVILITAWLVIKSWQFKTWRLFSWQFKTWMVNKSWQFKKKYIILYKDDSTFCRSTCCSST